MACGYDRFLLNWLWLVTLLKRLENAFWTFKEIFNLWTSWGEGIQEVADFVVILYPDLLRLGWREILLENQMIRAITWEMGVLITVIRYVIFNSYQPCEGPSTPFTAPFREAIFLYNFSLSFFFLYYLQHYSIPERVFVNVCPSIFDILTLLDLFNSGKSFVLN